MADRPPIGASPRPPDDSAPLEYNKTPAHGYVPGDRVPQYVRAKVAAAVAEIEAHQQERATAVEAELKKRETKLTLLNTVIAAGTVLSAMAGVILFVDNRVAAQTDAGTKVHEVRLSTLEQQRGSDRAESGSRFERLEASSNRQEKKLDALLDRLRVPDPAPTPQDGGR